MMMAVSRDPRVSLSSLGRKSQPEQSHRSRWLLVLLVAVLAGVSQALALALPGSGSGEPSGLLQIVGLAVFYGLLLRMPTAARSAGVAWIFATSWLVATFWWLFISMHTYGGLSAPLAGVAVLALAAFLALYCALGGWLWTRWRLRRSRMVAEDASDLPVTGAETGATAARILMFAFLWLGAELLRGTLWTGFPWGASGYAHIDNLLLRPFAPWLGVYGVGFVAAVLAAGLAEMALAARRRRWPVATAALLLPFVVVVLWVGAKALRPAGENGNTLSVALLQGNIPQDEKFVVGAGIEKSLTWYGQRLWSARADLIVLPETAIPLLPDQLPPDYWPQLQQAVTSAGQAALVGMPLGNLEEGYTNSVVGIAPGRTDEKSYRYDKYHLVPFGEFIPPMFRWFTNMMNIPLGDFNRGALGQPSFDWKGERIAPNICYEDLFGEELARSFANPAQAPTILANMSNIGWFGDTVAIAQHLNISRMRALEFDRPMLRATNTGATAVIDHNGRVKALAEPYSEAVLLSEVTGRSGMTPYAKWASRYGLLPLELIAAAAALWALFAGRQRRRVR